ncbi:trypsin-1-like [Bactrocera dorsalis]|uniref:Trypsin-1-like n=1 Tax=Bactrocera dorsalis TaxID=27457 RepID=A0A6I9VFY5_BACDO|nr:trypsin-1-like [Bactrocera dorsalis]
MAYKYHWLAALILVHVFLHYGVASVVPATAATPTALRQDNIIGWITAIFRPNTTASPSTSATPATPMRNCPSCNCGSINTFHRIVGGMDTEVNEYPWMAMLMRRGDFYCGGALINDQYVLTAAHCVRGFNKRQISVRLLSHNRTDGRVSTIDRQLDKIMVHDGYSTRNLDNDIALLRFTEPVELRDPLRPVCLAEAGNTYDGELAVVTGWGAVKEGGFIADRLQEVQVPVMSQETCRKSKYGSDRITDNMLCAGYPEGGKDSCQGDSGGPLHIPNNATKAYQLAGVVSWGEGCARPNAPGVYTRVTQYLDWIETRTGDSCKCVAGSEAAESESSSTTQAAEIANSESSTQSVVDTTSTTAASESSNNQEGSAL